MSITEGFICPECMRKCVSLKTLQDHFQQVHIDQIDLQSGDSNGFLGIIKKAKKTFEEILDNKDGEPIFSSNFSSNVLKNVDENNDTENVPFVSQAFYEEPNIKPQSIGVTVNRTEDFLKIRRTKLLRSAIETSSLILKIEKLISFQSNASNRDRKNFEQSIVEWVKDDLVPMCPMCGGKFGINSPISTYSDIPAVLSSSSEQPNIRKHSRLKTALINFMDMEIEGSGILIRKKHHCRLCGCVICAHCSYMLSVAEASKLVNAVNSRFELKESFLEESGRILWKNDSQNSLDSIKSRIKTQTVYCIRCCGNCKSLIEAKWNQLERRVCDSEIVDLYDDLKININKASQLIPEYNTMCQSLCLGETEYSFQRTNELRSEIVQLCQKIDAIGNKFKLRTPTNGNEREGNLVKAIYRNTFLFLQNNFTTLKQLPHEDKLEEIVNQRLKQIKKKAATIQKNRSPEFEKYIVKSKNCNSGWAPTISNNSVHHTERHNKNTNPFEYDNEDSNSKENTRLNALALQIENVRQYIELARQAEKFQEVKMLQNNMLDLKLEYEALQKKLKI